jgi:hypothetical protein
MQATDLEHLSSSVYLFPIRPAYKKPIPIVARWTLEIANPHVLTTHASNWFMLGYSKNIEVRVNDTGGHITYLACVLKSHILQTRLTGHTTCEICASKVTNRLAVRFLVKKHHAMHPMSFGPRFFLVWDFRNISGNRFSRSPPKILKNLKIIWLYLNFSLMLRSILCVY